MRTLKQKKRNRLLAALLAVAMMFQMLPLMAFADGGTGSTAEKVRLNGKYYNTLQEAIDAAGTEGNGYTIYLGKGVYSLTGDENEKIKKSLTFVGAGIGKTTWQIRAPERPYGAGDNWHSESDGDGGDGWCDYGFDGSDSITFQDMTVIGSVDPDGNIQAHNLQGFIRIQHITLDNCEFKGRADYWGYTSTTFNNVTFYAPGTAEFPVGKTDYSLWTYTGSEYTFRNCTFHSNGKTINVYRTCDPRTDPNVGVKDDVTVNFDNCTVYSPSTEGKQALKIDDTYMGYSKFILNITNPQVTATRDKFTCSQVFGFGDKEYCNTGKTDVKINGEVVWSGGKKLTHSYTDGKKDQAYDITNPSDWREWKPGPDRIQVRDVTRKCKYCGWEEPSQEYASVYSLQYNLNGGTGAKGANYEEHLWRQDEDVPLAADPSREGYKFVGWKDAAGRTYSYPDKAETVLKLKRDTVLTAQWADLANDPILTVEGGTITAKKDGAELTLNIQEVGDTQKTTVPAGAEVTVELNKDAIPQNMNFDRWTLDGWTLDDEMLKNELDAALNQETIKFTMPTHDLSVEAVYQGTAGDSGDSSIIGTVVIGAAGAALLGWGTYQLGTECLKKYYGLPYFPSNRSVLAMMLWEDAGKPMPESELLYPDVGQEERDMDLQHAARWAMENELFPDLNDEGTAEEERKFYPDNTVSKISALRAWRKAQELKQKA